SKPPIRLWKEVRQRSPATLPGTIWASAPTIVAITRLRISPCDPAGAGRCTLTMVPGGVITSMGRNEPWFRGACGSNTDLTVMRTPAAETAAVELTGNGTCDEAPVK